MPSFLANLYDPLTIPPGLFKASQELDRAVLELNSLSAPTREADFTARILKLCQEKTEEMT